MGREVFEVPMCREKNHLGVGRSWQAYDGTSLPSSLLGGLAGGCRPALPFKRLGTRSWESGIGSQER